ncbi:MAG: hypothetical protein WA755_14905 [Candidatus Acidiferrales bacterium]
MKTALLRAQLEKTLRSKVLAPFSTQRPAAVEMTASGIPEIDRLTGGLPRGCLTEIFGPLGSGRTSLLVSLLSALTNGQESCALVDGRDSFDPCGAEASGVDLEKLLLVRCNNIEQALRAADLLLHGGGFGLVALDLSDLPERIVRRVPLNVWFRFRRMVENTRTIFVLLEQESCAKTCASLVLRLEMEAARWRSARKISGTENPQRVLLGGLRISAEVVRCRFEQTGADAERTSGAPQSVSTQGARCGFESQAAWNILTEKRKRRKNSAIRDSPQRRCAP